MSDKEMSLISFFCQNGRKNSVAQGLSNIVFKKEITNNKTILL